MEIAAFCRKALDIIVTMVGTSGILDNEVDKLSLDQ